MSDHSLMNPDHLKKEMVDTNELIPKIKAEAKNDIARIEKIRNYVRDTHNAGESTTLTHQQVSELLELLGSLEMDRRSAGSKDEFYLRVCQELWKDRCWFIGSLFTFLRRK